MTSSTDIIAKFEAAFEAFETTDDRPTNLYVTQIYDDIDKIFCPNHFDSVGATQNLMGLIDKDAAYASEYGELFPQPECTGIYATDIDTTKDAYLESRKKEAGHKTRIFDWELYNVAKSAANHFIVRVVVDV